METINKIKEMLLNDLYVNSEYFANRLHDNTTAHDSSTIEEMVNGFNNNSNELHTKYNINTEKEALEYLKKSSRWFYYNGIITHYDFFLDDGSHMFTRYHIQDRTIVEEKNQVAKSVYVGGLQHQYELSKEFSEKFKECIDSLKRIFLKLKISIDTETIANRYIRLIPLSQNKLVLNDETREMGFETYVKYVTKINNKAIEEYKQISQSIMTNYIGKYVMAKCEGLDCVFKIKDYEINSTNGYATLSLIAYENSMFYLNHIQRDRNVISFDASSNKIPPFRYDAFYIINEFDETKDYNEMFNKVINFEKWIEFAN